MATFAVKMSFARAPSGTQDITLEAGHSKGVAWRVCAAAANGHRRRESLITLEQGPDVLAGNEKGGGQGRGFGDQRGAE